MNKFLIFLRENLLSKKVFYVAIAFFVIMQLIYVGVYFGSAQSDDGAYYLMLATQCVELNTWYPDVHNLNQSFIFAPAYVNLLILCYKIFGSFAYIALFNLLFNFGLIFVLYSLAKKVFSAEIARLALIIFSFTYTNYTAPIAVMGELAYVFLAMLSMLLVTRKTLPALIMAGVCIALANWVRPLAVIFVATSLVYMFFNKYSISKYVAYFVSIGASIFLIASPVNDRLGRYVFASNTSGANLITTANYKANGWNSQHHMTDPFYAEVLAKQYPDNDRLFERDKDMRNRAFDWIIEHPVDYIKQVPAKLVFLYCLDNWSIRSIKGNGFADVFNSGDYSTSYKAKVLFFAMLKSTVYYISLLLFLVYLWVSRKTLFKKENIFLLIPFMGTGLAMIFTIIDRYHYPFMPIIQIYAAAGLLYLLRDKSKENLEKTEEIEKSLN